MRNDGPDRPGHLGHRRRELTVLEERNLHAEWEEAVRSFRGARAGHRGSPYARRARLFDIVRNDGRIKLLLGYDEENPAPDLKDYGQRRQVESLLGFEKPLERLLAEAEERWLAGDYEGEATLLEEFANSNPQKDSILDLAAEARRDAMSVAPTRMKARKRT